MIKGFRTIKDPGILIWLDKFTKCDNTNNYNYMCCLTKVYQKVILHQLAGSDYGYNR